MKVRLGVVAAVVFYCAAAGVIWGQDLDPQIRKITDGIYVYVGKNLNSNAGIVLTQEGVVLVDSGHNPTDSRAIAAAVKKTHGSAGALPHRHRAARRSHDRPLCLLAAGDHHRPRKRHGVDEAGVQS